MKLYVESFKDRNYGPVAFGVTEKGLRVLTFRETDALERIYEHSDKHGLIPARSPKKTAKIRRQLKEYFGGKRKSFKAELDLGYLPPFTQKVLRAARRIGYGRTLTYGQLARQAGSPDAARAAGQVMATNPIPIVIPCHRVIGSNGQLVGYGGGLDLKASLLQKEGAIADERRKSRR